jgi:hypothetical protein
MNSGTGILDILNQIATDNSAKIVATSWGGDESSQSDIIDSESPIFQQMASQGQTFTAASGDMGAYDDGSSLSVDDPSSQPYVLGVGGTTLTLNVDGSYSHESAWGDQPLPNPSGGGGGISSHWTKPSYQSGLGSSGNMRDVPDVALNSASAQPYSIYEGGGWVLLYGTSAASPLWAAFLSLVDQQRASTGRGPVGFVNPAIYTIARGSKYATDFHDISDGTNNLYYSAVPGYDDATGWGSFIGAALIADLAGSVPAAPAALTATAGNAKVTLSWSASTGATSYNVKRSTLSGSAYAIIGQTSSTGYLDTTVTNGVTYYYVVSGVNASGESPNSAQVSARPFAPTLSSITVTPSPAFVAKGHAQQFTAVAKDQNGVALSTQPAFTWSVSGGGTISGTGLFTAGTTAGGPFTVTASSGGVNGTASVTVVNPVNPVVDFNGDGQSDLVLQNASTGQAYLWFLNGATVAGGGYTSVAPPSGWRIVAAGDFNGDGRADLALRNASTRRVALWYCNGTKVIGSAYVGTALPSGWNVVASGDFNGDGKRDLALQNSSTRQIALWYLSGGSVAGGGYVATIPASGWTVVAAGDFNGDGKTDLALQNSSTHQVAIWYLNGLAVSGGGYVSSTPPAGWAVVGAADYNGDGKADLLLQNTSTNKIAIWYLNGTSITGSAYVSITPASAYKVAGPR